VLPLWGAKLAIEIVGAHLGLARLGRRDLAGPPVVGWALLHPFFVATVLVASVLRPSSWEQGRAGTGAACGARAGAAGGAGATARRRGDDVRAGATSAASGSRARRGRASGRDPPVVG
jgi:hypothetical protein